MTKKMCTHFASAAWWDENPLTDPAMVQAILSLSSDKRPSETIWQAPTAGEWRQVARLTAEYGDDGNDDAGGDIVLVAGEVVVDAENVVAFVQQALAQMRSEKARAAGHQNSLAHIAP